MSGHGRHDRSKDPHNLERFVRAQEHAYNAALTELRLGRKRSHWMWYIFPQFAGLGRSPMSREYSIKSAEEALAYLNHPVVGPRLLECAAAIDNIEESSALEVFGSPDDMKLRSCATLFARLSDDPIFQRLLDKYFEGQSDPETIRLMDAASA